MSVVYWIRGVAEDDRPGGEVDGYGTDDNDELLDFNIIEIERMTEEAVSVDSSDGESDHSSDGESDRADDVVGHRDVTVAELVAASHIDPASGIVTCHLEPFLHKPFLCRVRNFPVVAPMARQRTECRCFKHVGCKILKPRSRWSIDMALTWFYSGMRPEVDSAKAHMDLATTVEEMQLH